VTVMDRDSCQNLGCLATPEQIADAYAKTGIPAAPDVRPAADEMREISDPKPSERVENIVVALLVALPIAVLTFGPLLS
jgi:hypothetical protein